MKPLFSLVSLVSVLLFATSSFGQVEIISRSSFINASDLLFDGPGESDMQSFFGEGTFNSTATALTANANSVITSQNSTVTSTLFGLETFSDSGLATEFSTESITILDVDFEVTAPTSYLLEGSLFQEFFGPANNSSSISLSLTSATSTLFSIFSDPGQTDVSMSGLLPAGVYSFNFNSTNLAGEFERGATSSSDLSLTFTSVSVPEPTSSMLLCWGVLAIAARRNRAC